MANKTMHHAVIGPDTFELVDQSARADVSDLKNAITTKAEQDGAYPDLTAGQMLSKVEQKDSVPYNFRAVGHEATLEYTDAIVGGSVVANQLAGSQDRTVSANGITISFDHNTGKTTVTVSDSPTGFAQLVYYGTPAVSGHRYLICADKPLVNGMEVYIGGTTGIRGVSPAPKNQTAIETAVASSATLQFFVGQSTSVGTYEYYVQIVDLTQMLGTTIADYVYTLETATAGSGVAWLKEHFSKIFGTYQEYNAGEIVSVQGLSQHVTVGFNQWDEEWESGFFNTTTGVKIISVTRIRSKNPIKVFPSTNYYIKNKSNTNIYCFAYDADMNFIDYWTRSNSLLATPANCCYLNIAMYDDYGTVYKNDISVNLSDPTRNGEYESYQKRTYPLDDSLTLRGLLKLDASNNLYADGDRYLPDGTVQRRYGERAYQSGDVTDGSTMITDGTNTVYKLTTPTTEEADPYTVPQIIDPDGTEEFVTTSIVPVGHESRYPDDLRAKIDALPWNLSMIAPIENGDKASQAYAVGKYFLHNNQFCKAKTAIASGATLTLNTNYEVTTVADEIYSALH